MLMAAEAGGIPDKVVQLRNKLVGQGGKLSTRQVNNFLNDARILAARAQQAYNPIKSRFTQRSSAEQVDPSLVIHDPFEGQDLSGAATQSPAFDTSDEAPPAAVNVRKYLPKPTKTVTVPPPSMLPVPSVKTNAAPQSGALLPFLSNVFFNPNAFSPTRGN